MRKTLSFHRLVELKACRPSRAAWLHLFGRRPVPITPANFRRLNRYNGRAWDYVMFWTCSEQEAARTRKAAAQYAHLWMLAGPTTAREFWRMYRRYAGVRR